ncbi:hypothetical protein CP533_0005, partial [Ophiocordyceps camponoti-saundersi (nom. inval.)]
LVMLSRAARAQRLAAVVRPSLGRAYSRKPPRYEPPSPPKPSQPSIKPSSPQPPRHGSPGAFAAKNLAKAKTPDKAPQAAQPPQAEQPSSEPSPNEAFDASQTPPQPPIPPQPKQDAQEIEEIKSPETTEPTLMHNLPDLTRGIPSTFEQEMQESSVRSSTALQTVDVKGRGRRQRRETYIPSSERNRKWWLRFMLVTTVVGSSYIILRMGRDWQDPAEAEKHPEAPNGRSFRLWWQRVRVRMGQSVSFYHDPAFEKLLPDPDPSFERPYTLCLSLDDLLVHSEWSREHGWRVAKRPGMDYFVRYLSQYYELVLFTTAPFSLAEPLVRKMDPFRFLMWPLYREATKFEDGEIVKDLSFLNRDLSKVIIIDTNPSHVRKQPENAIILDPWKGDVKDKELVSLIPFLEYIHTMQHPDVRKVIKSFEGKHIPTEFARREAIARKEFKKQLDAQKSKYSKSSGMGALSSLLGLKPEKMSMTVPVDGEQNPVEAFAQGKMLQDLARERGQRNYALLDQEIQKNGDKWLKEEQEMAEKLQKEAMNNMMSTVLETMSEWYSGSPPKPGSGGGKS